MIVILTVSIFSNSSSSSFAGGTCWADPDPNSLKNLSVSSGVLVSSDLRNLLKLNSIYKIFKLSLNWKNLIFKNKWGI